MPLVLGQGPRGQPGLSTSRIRRSGRTAPSHFLSLTLSSIYDAAPNRRPAPNWPPAPLFPTDLWPPTENKTLTGFKNSPDSPTRRSAPTPSPTTRHAIRPRGQRAKAKGAKGTAWLEHFANSPNWTDHSGPLAIPHVIKHLRCSPESSPCPNPAANPHPSPLS